jgi:hypothetical protein
MAKRPKVWFITGTSKGFGHIWAEAALERITTWEQWNNLSLLAHGNA